MSSTSSLANLGPSQFGQFGVFTVDSANPFYSAAVYANPVNSITADSAGFITYSFSNTVDLSKVVQGAKVIATNCPSAVNNGIKFVASVDDTANEVTVLNGFSLDNVTPGVTETADMAKVEIHGLRSLAIYVVEDCTVTSVARRKNAGSLPVTEGYTAGLRREGDLTEFVVSSGVANIYLAGEYIEPGE